MCIVSLQLVLICVCRLYLPVFSAGGHVELTHVSGALTCSLKGFPFHYSRGDFVKITDEYNVELGRYCSERIGKEIYIGGSHTMITFRTDGRNHERGFLMVFAAAKPRECN